MRSLLFCLLALPLATPAWAAESPEGEIVLGDDLVLRPLTKTVWLHVSSAFFENGQTFTNNGLVVTAPGQSLIIDTPWNVGQTQRLLDWLDERGQPVAHLIATHSHADNMGGIAAVHARDIPSHALAMTVEFAKRDGNPPPTHPFTDLLELELGEEVAEARYLGGGHTRDNIVVWLRRARVLFGGCLVKNARARGMGFIGEADLEAWPLTLEKLRERYPDAELIVPGHGEPGGEELIENSLRLLVEHAKAGE